MKIKIQRWVALDHPMCVFAYGPSVNAMGPNDKQYFGSEYSEGEEGDIAFSRYSFGPVRNVGVHAPVVLQLGVYNPELDGDGRVQEYARLCWGDVHCQSYVEYWRRAVNRFETRLSRVYGAGASGLLNGVPNETKSLSSFICAAFANRSIFEPLEFLALPRGPERIASPDEYDPPDVSEPAPLSGLARLFLSSHRQDKILADRRNALRQRSIEEYRQGCYARYERKVEEHKTRLAQLQESHLKAKSERAKLISEYEKGPFDQSRILYPYDCLGLNDDTLTPLHVPLPRGYPKYAHFKYPNIFPKITMRISEDDPVETYAYRRFLYLVSANTLEVPDLAGLVWKSYDRDLGEVSRLRTRAELVGKGPRRDPIPDGVRVSVWRRDEGRCRKCGSQEKLEFDHIIPVAKGGSNTERNIQLLCEHCNRSKSDKIT